MPMDSEKIYQEQVNKRVLCQWVRILGLPTKRNPNYDQVLGDLAEKILEYPKEKGNPFSWPSAAGLTSTGPAIRCKMTYDFWKYFLRVGSRRLSDYNQKEKTQIRLIRERTKNVDNLEKLCLYIRKTIRAVSESNKDCPSVTISKGKLKIGNSEYMSPAVAAVKLNIDLSQFEGPSLFEMLSVKELNDVKAGKISFGEIKINGLRTAKGKELGKEVVTAMEEENGVSKKRRRVSSEKENEL